jgi:hypothetical protein
VPVEAVPLDSVLARVLLDAAEEGADEVAVGVVDSGGDLTSLVERVVDRRG